MRGENKINKKSLVSILEIFILMFGLFAFAFILGQNFKSVSAEGTSSVKVQPILSPAKTKEAMKILQNTLQEVGWTGVNTIKKTSTPGTLTTLVPSSYPVSPAGLRDKLRIEKNLKATTDNTADSKPENKKTSSEKISSSSSSGLTGDLAAAGGGYLISSMLFKGKPYAGIAGSLAGVIIKNEIFSKKGVKSGFLGDLTKTEGVSGTGAVFQSAAWAAAMFLASKMIVSKLDIGGYKLSNSDSSTVALLTAGAFGIARYGALTGGKGILSGNFFGLGNVYTGPLMWAGAVMLVSYLLLSKNKKIHYVTLTCSPWRPQLKGADCEACNGNLVSCSEYQCRSLGQACALTPADKVGKRLCFYNNSRDVLPPIIKPSTSLLSPDLKYTPNNKLSPPDRGVYITYTGGTSTTSGEQNTKCIPAFTPFTFGIKTNEPSQCKISKIRTTSFEKMGGDYFDSGSFAYNHSTILSFPSENSLNASGITLANGNKFNLYVRCRDANGNVDKSNFGFNFCINNGPDTTPPIIVGTSIVSGSPVSYNTSNINDFGLYVNEPSTCKWSHIDLAYKDMPNNFTCATSPLEMNAQMTYTCKTNLTGIGNLKNNYFFFRCKDQPNSPEKERNVDTQSTKFLIKGTRPLILDSAGPNNIVIKNSVSPTEVDLTAKTSAGADYGKAVCSYEGFGTNGKSIDFFYKDASLFSTNTHLQKIWLPTGNYNYTISCRDLGNNVASKNISFEVYVDNQAPLVVRTYREDNNLAVVTNENSSCVYDTKDCNYLYEDGIKMKELNGVLHYVNWDTSKNYYIKCEDRYNNRPNPGECSIILNPFRSKIPLKQ